MKPSSLPTILLLLTHRSASLSTTFMSMSTATTMTAKKISVKSAGFHLVNGVYDIRPPTQIPDGFDKTCRAMNWDTERMWNQLSDPNRSWYELEKNGSYIYFNRSDSHWWIDGPSGAGVYIAKEESDENEDELMMTNASSTANIFRSPPQTGWRSLHGDFEPIPEVLVHADVSGKGGEL